MSEQLGDGLVYFVALQHLAFMILEMFLWTKPVGLKIFRMDDRTAEASRKLAMNQGLYNGFLAGGLVFSLVMEEPPFALFFLGCVVVAGVFGAATVSRRILVVQALPAAIAFGLVLLNS